MADYQFSKNYWYSGNKYLNNGDSNIQSIPEMADWVNSLQKSSLPPNPIAEIETPEQEVQHENPFDLERSTPLDETPKNLPTDSETARKISEHNENLSPLEGTINPTIKSVPDFARQDTPDLRTAPPEDLLGDNLSESEPPSPPPLDSILGQYQSPRKPDVLPQSRFKPKTPEPPQQTHPKAPSLQQDISIEDHMSFGDLIDPPTPQTNPKKKSRLSNLLNASPDSENSKSSGHCSDRLEYRSSLSKILIKQYQSLQVTLTQHPPGKKKSKPWKHKSSEPLVDIDLDDLIKLKEKLASENAKTEKNDGSGFGVGENVGFEFCG